MKIPYKPRCHSTAFTAEVMCERGPVLVTRCEPQAALATLSRLLSVVPVSTWGIFLFCSLGLENVILDAFPASLASFVDGSGFLDVSSVFLVGSLLKLMRSAPRSGYIV